jgi:hypothetical protein
VGQELHPERQGGEDIDSQPHKVDRDECSMAFHEVKRRRFVIHLIAFARLHTRGDVMPLDATLCPSP